MTRPNRDTVLMETAHLWAKRGTCSRLQVGAVFSRDGRILAQGYNGAPAGMPHCIHVDDEPCTKAMHAEANGIAWAARHGVRLELCDVHVTNLPCVNCAMLLINAGVYQVMYDDDYRVQTSLSLFREASILVRRYGSID